MKVFNPWLTPKIFDKLTEPQKAVEDFFEIYKDYIEVADEVVINFCTGNGDHILNYKGKSFYENTFDWGRYNRYPCDEGMTAKSHTLGWLKNHYEPKVEDLEYYPKGPSFMTHDEPMDYNKLQKIYQTFYSAAKERRINFKILEYLEPGPEFCNSVWKNDLHPEVAPKRTIDICKKLHSD